MKLIGVTGKSGSGKTTFTELLQKIINCEVIHLDNIFDSMKDSLIMRPITNKVSDNHGRESKRILSSGIKKFIHSNNFTFRSYIRFRSNLANRIVKNKIEQYEKGGVKVVVIEGAALPNLKIVEDLNYILEVKAPYHLRIDRVSNRDNFSDKKYVVDRDRQYSRDVIKKINKRRINYTVNNDSSLKHLEDEAEKVSKEISKLIESKEKKYRDSLKVKHISKEKSKEREYDNRIKEKLR